MNLLSHCGDDILKSGNSEKLFKFGEVVSVSAKMWNRNRRRILSGGFGK